MIVIVRRLLALPFMLGTMALALLIWAIGKAAAFLGRTSLLVSIGDAALDPASMVGNPMLQRFTRALAFIDGRCWRCGADGGADDGLE